MSFNVRIVIRVDSSIQMGSGHIMRCLTLANALRKKGAILTFICREHPGHLFDLIETSGYQLIRLSAPKFLSSGNLSSSQMLGVSQKEDAQETMSRMKAIGYCDWLIVDHYSLDIVWESAMRSAVKTIMIIDDLANRRHDYDLLLDQNYYRNLNDRYDGLVPVDCLNLLLHSQFASPGQDRIYKSLA